MKATKKIVSLTLAVILVMLAFAMPVSAARALPLIIVDGIFSTALYQNIGTEEEKGILDFTEEEAEDLGVSIGMKFALGWMQYGMGKKDYQKFADEFLPAVNQLIEPIGYNADGTPKNDTIGFHQQDKPMSEYTEEEQADFGPFAQAYAKEYGAENVYTFRYDWREDPIAIAEELDAYIAAVKENTGARKVNLIGYSMGANIVLAYLNAHGGSDVNSLVFASPAWQGTSLAGNVAANKIEIDIFAVENYLVQMADVSATTHLTAFIISFIASSEGLSHEYFGDINYNIQQLLPYIYKDTIIPNIAGMPGFWSLVPKEDFAAGKEFLFPEGIDPALEAKIDAYHNIQVNAKAVIEDAMADGMKFGIVGGYNCQMIPISSAYEQSDTIIDVKYWSGNATCSLYLQEYDDWDELYTQKNKDGHNHVSWDNKVDASTCMFPEYTWFIKNMQHTYNADNGTTDVAMMLLGAKDQVTVYTDMENYPQFFLYNTYKRTTKAMPLTIKIGDVDKSTDVSVVDARAALKMAAGQIKPTDEQLGLADLDGDGKVTTEDVREILCLATGIEYK